MLYQGPLLMTGFANSEEKPKMYPPVLVKTVSGKERPVRINTKKQHADLNTKKSRLDPDIK